MIHFRGERKKVFTKGRRKCRVKSRRTVPTSKELSVKRPRHTYSDCYTLFLSLSLHSSKEAPSSRLRESVPYHFFCLSMIRHTNFIRTHYASAFRFFRSSSLFRSRPSPSAFAPQKKTKFHDVIRPRN